MDRARIILEVVAGVIPNQPDPKYTKRFGITSDVWYQQQGVYAEDEKKHEAAAMEIMKTYGAAQEYMRSLWNPQLVNWVRCDWIYL